jgi:hypothetical protein
MAGRFIKLYDKILKWEWFKDANTLQLFLHLLLKANYKDSSFKGVKVRRGQIITSLSKLSQATGQTVRQIRDNLNHLEMTGEVTSQSTNRYRIITIVRYDEYQTVDKPNDKQLDKQLDKQMTSQPTSQPTTSIEYIENIERDRNIELPKGSSRSASRFTPPTKDEVLAFCQENGFSIDVDYLYDYYAAKGWKIGNNSMKDWKAAVRNWARREKTPAEPQRAKKVVVAQDYDQRDYGNAEDGDAMQRMLRMGGF